MIRRWLSMATLIGWIVRAVVFGSVVMYGAMGEILTEKAGHLNLGTPGIMCTGGAFGFAAAYAYENAVDNPNFLVCILVAVGTAFLAGALAGLIYCFLTATLLVNQNVVGLTLTIFGVGVGKFFGTYVIPEGAVSTKAVFANKVFIAKIPGLSGLGVVGELLFSYGFMIYLAIVLAIVVHLFLSRTRVGLNLRAVGENPATADAAGINVTKYKYCAIMIGSGITGLGGVLYVLDYGNGTWATASGDAIEALAWLSVALVIFVRWNTLRAIWGSYLFGLCYWAYNYVPTLIGVNVTTELAQMLPYIVTIVILILGCTHMKQENQGPAYLGQSYFREDR